MKSLKLTTTTFLLGAALVLPLASNAAVVTFDSDTLAPNSDFGDTISVSGPTSTIYTFTSEGVTFDYNYTAVYDEGFFLYDFWSNFTYSSHTDTTTPGFGNQYSAITGDGNGSGQDQYGITTGAGAYINFGSAAQVSSFDVTNTTYAYLSMLNGDSFAKQFEAGDFFRVTVSELGNSANNVEFSLAEGTDILDTWLNVDLSSLGVINGLEFSYSSSDVGSFGINTPLYFAIDNIEYQAVPVPAAAWLLLTALSSFPLCKRYCQRKNTLSGSLPSKFNFD